MEPHSSFISLNKLDSLLRAIAEYLKKRQPDDEKNQGIQLKSFFYFP